MLIDKIRLECQSFRLTMEDAPSLEYIARFIAKTQQRWAHGRPDTLQRFPLSSPSLGLMARLSSCRTLARLAHLTGLVRRYTQRGGVRPFGVSSLLAGFGADGQPQIYQIDPSGTYFSWRANAIGGKNSKGMREFLEKEWVEGLAERDAVKLTVKTLLEVRASPPLCRGRPPPPPAPPHSRHSPGACGPQVVDSGSKNMELVVVREGASMAPIDDDALAAITAEVAAEVEAAKTAGAQEMKD